MARPHFRHFATMIHLAWCISPSVRHAIGLGGLTSTSGFFVLTHYASRWSCGKIRLIRRAMLESLILPPVPTTPISGTIRERGGVLSLAGVIRERKRNILLRVKRQGERWESWSDVLES